jgi:hypothetical protein
METLEAYLQRKYEELNLLNRFLSTPLSLRHPASVAEVIEQKFHLAAALKAEHALHDWALTETAWAYPDQLRAGRSSSATIISVPTWKCAAHPFIDSTIRHPTRQSILHQEWLQYRRC